MNLWIKLGILAGIIGIVIGLLLELSYETWVGNGINRISFGLAFAAVVLLQCLVIYGNDQIKSLESTKTV